MAILVKSQPKATLLMILLILLIIGFRESYSAILTSGGVSISSSTINQQSTLSVYAVISTTIPAGGTIKVLFPIQVTATPSTSCTLIIPSSSSISCSYSTIAATSQIQMTATVGIQVTQYFQINIPGFTNPFSTTATSSLAIYTYDKSNTLLDSQITNINIQATSDNLKTISLSSSSQVVGYQSSVLTVTVKTTNIIPANGKLYVYFPFWNPQASNTIYTLQQYVNTNDLSCAGITNIVNSPTCTFSSSTQTLTLSAGFVNAISAGSTISFSISTIKNPITSQQQTGFIVSTGDSASGIIDQGSGTITVTQSSTIVSSSLIVNSYIVQEYSRYRLQFMMPVPLNANCRIEIAFPSEITLDSKLVTVTGLSFFGAERQFTGSIDYNKNSYVITNGCLQYQDNSLPAIIYFNNIVLPDYVTTTGSIGIYVSDSLSYLVSSTTNGPNVTSLPGSIAISSMVSDSSTQVNSETNIIVTFQPLHALSKDAIIQISLPIGQLTLPNDCSIIPVQGISSNIMCSSFDSNTLLLINVFDSEYKYQAGQPLVLNIQNVILPGSTAPTGDLHIETYTSYNGDFYMVDYMTASNLFNTTTQGDLTYARVIPKSSIAGTVTTYNIEFMVQDPILQNGKILVLFPSGVSLVTPSSSTCSNFSSTINSATASCSFTSNSVLLTGGFSQSEFKDVTTKMLYFSVSGVQNPRSLQVTFSFSIITKDQNNYLIDSKNDSIVVQMTQTATITSASVSSSSYVVGDNAKYLFTLTSPTPLYNGDQVYVQMPTDINQPLSNSLSSCQGSASLQSTLKCRISGQYGVYVILALYGSTVITANQKFSFYVQTVQNPASTKRTGSFTVIIYDSNLSQLNSMNTAITDFTLAMTTPATITQASIIHQSQIAFDKTSFVITMTLAHTLPAGAQIYITYPSQITLDTTSFSCAVSMATSTPVCTFMSITNNHWILMKSVTGVAVVAGSSIQITLNGLINSLYAAQTDSFTVQTQTQDGYLIDQITSGLSVSNTCNYPCMSCLSTNVNYCQSCDSTSKYDLIYNGQCLSICPAGFYESQYTCLQCDSSCLSCSGGPLVCTSCPTGKYLLSGVCLDSCPTLGYYQDPAYKMCRECNSPCQTCPLGVNTCGSCLSDAKNNLFFKGQCYSSCPSGISVYDDGVCDACSSNCQTCKGSPDVCTSCVQPLKLNNLNFNCVSTCPTGLTVDMGDRCDLCSSNCATCSSSNATYCLTCPSGLILNQLTNQCVTTCPSGTATVTLNNGQTGCQKCATGCTQCQNKVDYCTYCDASLGYVFYEFTCIKGSCPSGYSVINAQSNVCVRNGTVCDYGYGLNDQGICVLTAQVCRPGYVLNKTKTLCIPVPGPYVPLIFLIFAAIWTIYIMVFAQKQIKQPLHVVISQLLIGYTIIQTISYIVMFALAIQMGYRMIMGIHVLGFLAMYIINLAYGIFYKLKLRKQDIVFQHWATFYKKTFKIYNYAIYLFNYNMVRCLVTKLFKENKHFTAAFDDQFYTIIKPLFICNMINFVVQGMPIIIMDIYSFIFIPWGYQLMVMSIDNLVLAVVIFILEIIEYRLNLKLTKPDTKTYMSANQSHPKSKYNEDNVMGGMQDEDNSYVAFKGARDQTMDYLHMSGDLTDPDNKKFTNSIEKTSEAMMLEHLVKKLNQEQKFKGICQDAAAMAENDLNKSLNISYQDKQQSTYLKNREKKLALQTVRSRLEQSIVAKSSFANTKTNLFQQQLGDIDFVGVPSFSHTQQINLDSARTEKFRYPGSPEPVRHALLDPYSKEYQDKQDEQRELFRQEIQERLNKEEREKFNYVRDWVSFDENILRDQYVDMGPESNFGESISNNSFPHTPKKYDSVDYLTRLEMFRENLKAQYQFSNIYFDNYQAIAKRLLEQQTKRTQTYEKQLGGDPFDSEDEFMKFHYEDQIMEFDPQMAQDWIQNIIDHQTNSDQSNQSQAHSIDYDSDFDFEQKNEKSRKRKRDVQFELDDIIGAFDIDDYGNINLNKETMRDNFNRKINKHGYLVDQAGNIINQDGQIIFEQDELDSDEEIPRPFRFEKRKKQLLKSQQRFTIDPDQQQTMNEDSILAMEEDKIDEELEKIKILSRVSSIDSQIGENPSQMVNANNENDQNIDDDFDASKGKKSPSVSKKDMRMARAYGGQPPIPKPKRKKSSQQQSRRKDMMPIDRQATDRLFPSLHQEEERVKKLALLSYRSGKSGVSLPAVAEDELLDFEKYFVEQMNEIQQNRENEREQFQQQNNANIQEQEYQVTQPAFRGADDEETLNESILLNRLDSATTQRSIQRHVGDRSGLNLNMDMTMDPLQELSQIDEEKAQKQYDTFDLQQNSSYYQNQQQQQFKNMQFNVQSTTHMPYQKTQSSHMLPQQQQQLQNNAAPQYMVQNPSRGENQGNQLQYARQPTEERKTFNDFYLPKATLKSKYTKNLEKTREGRDSSLTNAGQITLQGNSRLKGLEKIYTKKFQHTSLGNHGSSMSHGAGAGGAVLTKRLIGGSTTNAEHKFRPMQHNFVDDAIEINKINKNDFESIGEKEDYDTVFSGIKKAFGKIDRIRQEEKEKRNHHGSSTTLEMRGQNLNVKNNNWF